jgi:GT2 family glycosyltransferase
MKFTVGIGATRAGTLEAAAGSICGQTWPDWELLIVGQGDDRALRAAGEHLQRSDSRIRYIHLPIKGLSCARNEVIRCAQGDVIAFTDDDCEADAGWLAVLAEYLLADDTIGLVAGALVPPPYRGLTPSACPALAPAEVVYDPILDRRVTPEGWDWVGANVAIRAEVVAQVGLFDELLGAGAVFPAGEDTDYKLRLEALGVRMLATPAAVVHHTYGRRVGARAVARSSRGYARGAGAVAGKLTLSGDARGETWVRAARRIFWRDLLKPGRSLAALYRLPHFLTAYREVVSGYSVDALTGLLTPRLSQPGRATPLHRARRGGAQCDPCGN